MRLRILLFTTFAFATAFIGVRSVSAQHSFNQTGAGTFDSNANGNWNNGVPTGDGQDVDFQQSISGGNQTVTNFFSSNGGSLNYLRLATGGSSLLTVISTAGFTSQYGLQLNANDTLILAS